MENLDQQIQNFKNWLIERNRDEETAEGYASDVRLCFNHPQAPLGRFRDPELAPKTLRRSMAAMRSWCKFNKNTELLEKLMDLKLPPPARKVAKVPLTRAEWEELMEEIDNEARAYLSPAERAVIGIMAVRGLRVGDVLRMTRVDLLNGKRTGVLSYEAKQGKRLEVSIKPLEDYVDWLLKDEGWVRVRDLISTRASEKTKQSSATQQISRALKTLGDKLGIPEKELYPHRLRRTYAVHFLNAAGGDLSKLQGHMSWSNIGTAAQYVDHSRREELDAIASAMIKRKK